MKVFVTGTAGQLGHDVAFQLISRGHDVICSDVTPSELLPVKKPLGTEIPDPRYIPLDITDEKLVKTVIEKYRPDAIIHCAAWTAVDAAEDEENHIKVDAINHLGTKHIAEAAKANDAKMIYISTDYVPQLPGHFRLNGFPTKKSG